MALDKALLRASLSSWLSFDDTTAGPRWWQLGWTVLFCAVVAVGFTVLGWLLGPATLRAAGLATLYGQNLVITLCVGFAIDALYALALATAGRARLAALAGWRRVLVHIAIPSTGVLLGWPLGLALVLGPESAPWRLMMQPRVAAASLLVALGLSVATFFLFDLRARRERAERQAAEARLRLLQGQIEPHFLFNTLANVAGLIEPQPRLARQMLEDFSTYLRGSLGCLRGEAPHTVGHELELVAAYLRVVAARMDGRLQVHWQVDEALRPLPLPPLLLQPLVENAVVHGLEPQVDGGWLRIEVARQGPLLRLCVVDNGAGLGAPAHGRGGSGTALANLRQRLHHAHGATAALCLEPGAPCGTRACITLPLAA